MSGWRRMLVVGGALAGLATAAGCGTQGEEPAQARTDHFYAAIAAGDAAAACGDLAPEVRKSLEQNEERPCQDAILDQDLPGSTGRSHVRVYGSAAQVARSDDTAFLSRFRNEWLITAVGCTPGAADQPYDCTIEVG